MDDQNGFTRRGFISGVGAAAAATAAVGAGAGTAVVQLAETGPAPLALEPGTPLGQWQVVGAKPMRFGAIPVVLTDETGERFQLDVLRRDTNPGRADGVGNTDHFSVFVSNNGNGQTATNESHGLAAMALAERLDRNGHAPPAELLTHAERREQHPDGAYAVPFDEA